MVELPSEENDHMERTDIRKRIGLRIKELRAERNISQDDLAYAIDMSRSYLAEVETGKRNISGVNIERISDGLDASVQAFFDSPMFGESKAGVEYDSSAAPTEVSSGS